jgi:hypothetical protein
MQGIATEWWPTIVMAGVYVAAWLAIIWIAAKALTDHRPRRPH